ncbi:MAG: hypothetical protein ABJG47_15610 [Ekhidna sp.]
MKYIILGVFLALSYHLNAQSVYSQKWKENTFFHVPHAFTKKVINENKVVYEMESEHAKLEIMKWPFAEEATNTDMLMQSVKTITGQLDYSKDEIISSELVDKKNVESDFIGVRLVLKRNKKKALITALYSEKTNKNYLVFVEANAKYFKNNKELIQRLSNGLIEY